ncbi:MAG: hypothetical protein ACO3GM_00815 [Candidatus Limnocylindrus sp.]
MSMYRYSDGERPLYRLPVTLEATAGGTVDYTISLSALADLDELWNNVQTNGYDIRVLQSDGRTAMSTWTISGFNATNRTGTIQVDSFAASAGMGLLWLVWGKPAGDAASTWSSVTMSAPKTTYVHRVDPLKLDPARVFRGAARGASRANAPRTELRKGSAEVIRVYFRYDGLKRGVVTLSQSSDDLDAPLYGSHDVVDENLSDVATMYTATDGRFAVDSDGRLYYSMLVKAGTHATGGTKYTARCLLVTNEGETIRYNGGVIVQDVIAS